MREYDILREIIEQAESVVFFGGAGVSTASGIPDFRGGGGLYDGSDEKEASFEAMLSISCFTAHPKQFYEYYRSHMLHPYALPNDAHIALAELEAAGKLSAVITQNIDGLHQLAGSKNVIELHGSSMSNTCIKCGKKYNTSYIYESTGVPYCTCGGIIRPDIVLYGEGVDVAALDAAEEYISACDVLIVGGTSLSVNPAATLVNCYEGDHLIIINETPTDYDGLAELVINAPLDAVLPSCV